MFNNKFISLCIVSLICFLSGCAAPLKVKTVCFMPPTSYTNHQNVDELEIAVEPVYLKDKSEEIFGTDLRVADILPVHIIVQNNGTKEYEINHQQIFGIAENQEYTMAYPLSKAAELVRQSSIGTTAVSGAVAGALVGAAVGAGMGAGIGHASGNTSLGAESGAIMGSTAGAVSGAGAGLSDSFTAKFRLELSNLAFEDRVIYPSDIQQGFIYLAWKPYNKIRVKVLDITDNKAHDLMFDIVVQDRKKILPVSNPDQSY